LGLRLKGGREGERAREREPTKRKQFLRERWGACSLTEVGLAFDALLTDPHKASLAQSG